MGKIIQEVHKIVNIAPDVTQLIWTFAQKTKFFLYEMMSPRNEKKKNIQPFKRLDVSFSLMPATAAAAGAMTAASLGIGTTDALGAAFLGFINIESRTAYNCQ